MARSKFPDFTRT